MKTFKDTNKFAVGDRIRISNPDKEISENRNEVKNEVGVITSVRNNDVGDFKYDVKFDNEQLNTFHSKYGKLISNFYFKCSELDYATIADTKTARKLYPNAKILGNGELQR